MRYAGLVITVAIFVVRHDGWIALEPEGTVRGVITSCIEVVTNNATGSGFPAGLFYVGSVISRNRSKSKNLFERRWLLSIVISCTRTNVGVFVGNTERTLVLDLDARLESPSSRVKATTRFNVIP